MSRFMSFSSGSCGNCYFLEGPEGALLIDAGVSIRALRTALASHGRTLDSFSNILLTHDHMDHIRDIGSYCKKLCKPVWATTRLHEVLAHHSMAAPHITSCRRDLNEGSWNSVGSFLVRYFIVPHDATQTVGYAIDTGENKFVIMTDIGHVTEEALSLASQADTVVIESNFDEKMLLGGPYTEQLKQRIIGGSGHLSNTACAEAVRRFWHPGLRSIFLCHLSENNNTPELAFDCTRAALEELGAVGQTSLRTLPRRTPSPLFNL